MMSSKKKKSRKINTDLLDDLDDFVASLGQGIHGPSLESAFARVRGNREGRVELVEQARPVVLGAFNAQARKGYDAMTSQLEAGLTKMKDAEFKSGIMVRDIRTGKIVEFASKLDDLTLDYFEPIKNLQMDPIYSKVFAAAAKGEVEPTYGDYFDLHTATNEVESNVYGNETFLLTPLKTMDVDKIMADMKLKSPFQEISARHFNRIFDPLIESRPTTLAITQGTRVKKKGKAKAIDFPVETPLPLVSSVGTSSSRALTSVTPPSPSRKQAGILSDPVVMKKG
jgi:hypothetical protein